MTDMPNSFSVVLMGSCHLLMFIHRKNFISTYRIIFRLVDIRVIRILKTYRKPKYGGRCLSVDSLAREFGHFVYCIIFQKTEFWNGII